VTLAVPNQGRLETIIGLIEKSTYSIHDLSRVELSGGVPRFQYALRGWALRSTDPKLPAVHIVYTFSTKSPTKPSRSTSDVNGLDPQIIVASPKIL